MEYKRKSARLPKSAEEKLRWRRVIVILEHCPLSVVRTEWGFELLSEKHRQHHARNNEDPAEWRPDVVHQALLHLLDSPLNRAGLLQVFLRTKKGVVIAVDPRLRVPRHIRLFEKMMVACLYKMKVRAANGHVSLLRVVKNPVTDHIPPNCTLFRVETDGEYVPDLYDFCAKCGVADVAGGQFRPFAFIIGGMSRGNVDAPYAPRGEVTSIRVSDRGMSAAAVCSLLTHAFEDEWLREDNEIE